MTNRVRNTTEEVKTQPLTGIAAVMPGGIEAMEARGQRELVMSDVLPVKMDPECRELLAEWGVVFGNPVEGDELFVNVALPKGWQKRRTEHSMWSQLVDELGRVRASIFYKAAFYDRRADLYTKARFGIDIESDRTRTRAHAKDADGTILFSSEWYEDTKGPRDPGYDRNAPHAYDRARAAACTWLDANRPAWKDRKAYWSTVEVTP